MHYWQSVVNDVQKNKQRALLSYTEEKIISDADIKITKEPREIRTYYLTPQYPNVYLTKREAECLFWMVQDHTIIETALKMGLSARTVEFYVKNMKIKLQCLRKKQLIEKILQTDLLRQLAQDGLCVVRH